MVHSAPASRALINILSRPDPRLKPLRNTPGTQPPAICSFIHYKPLSSALQPVKSWVNNMHLAIFFFFLNASNGLLFFLFFFARWINVANACSSHSVSSTELSFVSVMTITSSPLSKYPWSGREGNTVINGVEPYPVESLKEKDHCSGLKQLLNVESLSCREICSDMFPFCFAAQEMHNCMVDWFTVVSRFWSV